MDWVRRLFLLGGLVFLFGAIQSADFFLGVAGVYLMAKSWFNWGCNQVTGCGIKHPNAKYNE